MGDKPMTKGEKALFWVGSLAGIATSFFTVYDRVFGPAPPRLVVSFNESADTRLRITPSGDMGSGFTEEIPLKLRIENKGDKASANTKLYLTYGTSTVIGARGSSESLPLLTQNNEEQQQRTLTIENLNPGEVFLLPIAVRLKIYPEVKRQLFATPESDEAKKSTTFDYPIQIDISSDSAPNARTPLIISLGRCEVLARAGDVFWMGHSDERQDVSIIKVRADYPCTS